MEKPAADGFLALQQASQNMLQTALDFKVLICTKSLHTVEYDKQKKIRQKRAQEIRCSEVYAIDEALRRYNDEDTESHHRNSQWATTGNRSMLDLLDLEDKMSMEVEQLKNAMLDETADNQQLKLICDRIRLSSLSHKEAAQEYERVQLLAGSSEKILSVGETGAEEDMIRFTERDALVSEVLKMFRKLNSLREEQLKVQRELLKAQKNVSISWLKIGEQKSRDKDKVEDYGDLGTKSISKHNIWLKHCLTELILETKIHWVNDPILRELIVHSEE